MARPSATAARAVGGACLNVAFVALLLAFYCLSRRGGVDSDVSPSSPKNGGGLPLIGEHGHGWCDGLPRIERHEDRCGYLAAGGCRPRGYVDYLYLFYCVLGGERRRVPAYGAMAAWLAVLFYVLGDTAAVYFCSSLEGLSRQLGLSPAIAGATLLSLGNGAPDALSTVASFASGDGGRGKGGTTAVGLNGVLGGALFVSSVVLGVIGLRLGGQGIAVDRASFFRDASFLFLALAAVAVVLAVGEVTVWGAAAFTSLYLVYVSAVAFTPDRWSKRNIAEADHTIAASDSAELHNVAEAKFYADHEAQDPRSPETAPLLQYYAGELGGDWDTVEGAKTRMSGAFWAAVRFLELLLRLPRRLTIPDASKDRWSKPAAVTAATLAPLFLSCLCRRATGHPFLAVFLGGLSGLSLGILAFLTTDAAAPPTGRLLSAWLAGGFVMSVAWAYVVAGEVLSLLVSAGVVLSVDTAALGVTVLAWGNSLGDLVANVAVASHGGAGGAQVAVSGCYGGPVFNVLVGLGLSMLLSCWAGYPRAVEIPTEAGLFQTLGFVVAGLLWAVVLLPRRGMRVDRTLGLGLLAIYFWFLCINISQVLAPRGQQYNNMLG